MTRFEEASLNSMNMSITVAFCIAAYLEQSGIRTFSDDELKEFMSEISTDIEEWLRDEADCHSCKTEYDCYECEKYEESEASDDI